MKWVFDVLNNLCGDDNIVYTGSMFREIIVEIDFFNFYFIRPEIFRLKLKRGNIMIAQIKCAFR